LYVCFHSPGPVIILLFVCLLFVCLFSLTGPRDSCVIICCLITYVIEIELSVFWCHADPIMCAIKQGALFWAVLSVVDVAVLRLC